MHRNYFHWNLYFHWDLFTFFGRLCRWASFDKDGMITPYGIYMALVNMKDDILRVRLYSPPMEIIKGETLFPVSRCGGKSWCKEVYKWSSR